MRRFKNDCFEALQALDHRCSAVAPAAAEDVSDLRLATLEDDLAAAEDLAATEASEGAQAEHLQAAPGGAASFTGHGAMSLCPKSIYRCGGASSISKGSSDWNIQLERAHARFQQQQRDYLVTRCITLACR